MKTNKKVHFSLLLLTLVMLLTSCSNMISVEKRKYRKGFYIEHVAKPSSANNKSTPSVAETKAQNPSQALNQIKEDSLPKESVCVKESFTEAKIAVPVKSKRKNVRIDSKKKIVKARPSFLVNSKKQAPAKNSQGGEEDEDGDGTGILIFFVIAASVLFAVFGLGIAAVLLLLMEMEAAALLVVISGIFAIAFADVLIIRSILKKRGKPARESED